MISFLQKIGEVLKKLLFILSIIFYTFNSYAQDKNFIQDVKTEKKPWTHLNFYNNPMNFQFAIVSDRTGGHRKGIFGSAVDKLNLIMPEMVLSVGDLIEGYTENTEEIDNEWKEFNSLIEKLEMPFFYLPGNHDISNKIMQTEWEKRFGRRYYHFIYKNVLFLLMDSNDGDGANFSKEQIDYFKNVIKNNKKVRWTLIFMHHPIWEYENAKSFKEIEDLFSNGKYTVYAGHTHQYMHKHHKGNNYYVLATTGGGSKLRGPDFGEFDHITWVTMTDNGPRHANIVLKSILDEDIYNEEKDKLAKNLINNSAFEYFVLTDDTTNIKNGTVYLHFFNQSDDTLNVIGQFNHNHQVNILKPKFEVKIYPQKITEVKVPFEVFAKKEGKKFDALELNWTLNYLNYRDLCLDGKTIIEVKTSECKVVQNKYLSFLDSLNIKLNLLSDDIDILYCNYRDENLDWKKLNDDQTIFETTPMKMILKNELGQISKAKKYDFNKLKLIENVKVEDLKKGLKYSYYEGEWKNLPNFNQLKVKGNGFVEKINLNKIRKTKNHYGIVFSGFIKVDKDGLFEFYTDSDDGSKLYINGEEVVSNDGSHSAKKEYGIIPLKKGYHPVKIEYFEDFGGEKLELFYKEIFKTDFMPLNYFYQN